MTQEQNRKKGGRPPTGRVRKLSKSVTVKFSKPSYEALRLRARKANRKLAEYIRESALNGEVVSGHNAETIAMETSLYEYPQYPSPQRGNPQWAMPLRRTWPNTAPTTWGIPAKRSSTSPLTADMRTAVNRSSEPNGAR